MNNTPYTDQLATQLKAKGVPGATIDTWMYRGFIPTRAIECKEYGRWTGEKFEWAKKVLLHPMIVNTKAGIPNHIGGNIANGSLKSIQKDDYTLLRDQVEMFVEQVKLASKKKEPEHIILALNNIILRRLTFLKQLGDKTGKKIDVRIRGGKGFRGDEIERVLNLLKQLATELK